MDPQYTSTVATGLKNLGEKLNVEAGCTDTRCLKYNATSIQDAVRNADLVVVCLGTGLFNTQDVF